MIRGDSSSITGASHSGWAGVRKCQDDDDPSASQAPDRSRQPRVSVQNFMRDYSARVRHDARARQWATLLPLSYHSILAPKPTSGLAQRPSTMVSTRSRTYPPTDAVAATSARTTTAQVTFYTGSCAHSTAADGEEKRSGALTNSLWGCSSAFQQTATISL